MLALILADKMLLLFVSIIVGIFVFARCNKWLSDKVNILASWAMADSRLSRTDLAQVFASIFLLFAIVYAGLQIIRDINLVRQGSMLILWHAVILWTIIEAGERASVQNEPWPMEYYLVFCKVVLITNLLVDPFTTDIFSEAGRYHLAITTAVTVVKLVIVYLATPMSVKCNSFRCENRANAF